MDFLEHLRAHKQQGAHELAARLAEEQKQKEDEAARSRAAEEHQRSQESERDKRQAEELFARLPTLVLEAAKQGHHSAVMSQGIVCDSSPHELPARAVSFNRRTYYLTGW